MKLHVTNDQKIDFVWHSNRIDFNLVKPSELDRSIVEKALTHDYGPTEIKDHFNALGAALSYVSIRNIHVERVIKSVHFRLMKTINPDCAGRSRTQGVWVGDYGTVDWQKIPAYLRRLNKMFLVCKTEEDCWNLHYEFEVVHPFLDGNGRTGRCLLAMVRTRLGFPWLVVQYDNRYDYYRMIQEYRDSKFKGI